MVRIIASMTWVTILLWDLAGCSVSVPDANESGVHTCTSDADCIGGYLCGPRSGTCVEANSPQWDCENMVCESGQICHEGACMDSQCATGAYICNDQDPCTYDDRCTTEGLCEGTSITCASSSDPCGVIRTCNGTSGCTESYPNQETACNDEEPCTHTDICDGAGGCKGTEIECIDSGFGCGAMNRRCNGSDTCTESYPDPTAECFTGPSCATASFCDGYGTCIGPVEACSGHGACDAVGTCQCEAAWSGANCDQCIDAVIDANGDCRDDLVEAPSAQFWMGCPDSASEACVSSEQPYHQVFLNRFFIHKTEVTVQDYQSCISASACSFEAPVSNEDYNLYALRVTHPMNGVTREEAMNYCEWVGMRLPTEAEWEYAARGTTESIYPWGNTPTPSCDDGYVVGLCTDRTEPVGSATSGISSIGAYDMAGNVQEWVQDYYDDAYYSEMTASGSNPTGPVCPDENCSGITRGGSYSSVSAYQFATYYRTESPTEGRVPSIGFRCVQSAPAAALCGAGVFQEEEE